MLTSHSIYFTVTWSNVVGKNLTEPIKATSNSVQADQPATESSAAPFSDLDFPSLDTSSAPYEEKTEDDRDDEDENEDGNEDEDEEHMHTLEMELNNEHVFTPLSTATDSVPAADVALPETSSDIAINSLSAQASEISIQHDLSGEECASAVAKVEQPAHTAAAAPAQKPVSKPAADHSHSAILHISSHSQRGVTKEMREGGDNGLGWVNSTNFSTKLATDIWTESSSLASQSAAQNASNKPKSKVAKKVVPPKEEEIATVACFTTDFSMQNVMLQMGLHIISASGMLVKRVKKWVLRCMACYKIQGDDLTRLFCSECGAAHLSRVSVSIENGELKVHLKKDYKVNTRGMQYSLPAPGKQGRFDGELLLREDQLLHGIWRQKLVKINKDVKSAFGEDVTSDVGIQMNKQAGIQVGMGKVNPNAQKGRERRGKSKRTAH